MAAVLKNATHKVKSLRLAAMNAASRKDNPFRDVTVTVIPFATTGQVEGGHELVPQIRTAFFEQTFWSIYRYFPHIAISVTRKRDLDFLNSLNLPVFTVFTSRLNEDPKSPHALNVKQALSLALNNFRDNATWSQFKYLYFSEGDLVLHMRNQESLFRMFESNQHEEEFFLSPHRMQVSSMYMFKSRCRCLFVILWYLSA